MRVDTTTSARRTSSRRLRFVLLLGAIALISSLLSAGRATAAGCAPHFGGSWIGTYSTADFTSGGAVRGAFTFTGNTLMGTAYFGPTDTTGSPVLATVNCNDVTLGSVAGATFQGTFAPDGKHMSGTYAVGTFTSGIWSTS